MPSLTETWGSVCLGPLYVAAKSTAQVSGARARCTWSRQLDGLGYAFRVSPCPGFTAGSAAGLAFGLHL